MKNIDIIEFTKTVNMCSNNKEACNRLNMSRDTFKKYCLLYSVNVSHFNPLFKIGAHTNIKITMCKKCNRFFVQKQFEKNLYCSQSCANSRVMSNETKQKISSSSRSCIRQTNRKPIRYKKICPVCNKEFEVYKCYKDKKIYCSKQCYKADIHCQFRSNGTGGYRKGSGTGKKGYYKGFWCDSTYELAYLIYCLEHNIDIKRNHEGFGYEYQNKQYTYYPDFIVNGKLVEIKGFKRPIVEFKINAVKENNLDLTILYKPDLKHVFDYIKQTRNVDLNRLYVLYDDHNPSFKYTCTNCNIEFETDNKRNSNDKFCSQRCAGLFRSTQRHFMPQ